MSKKCPCGSSKAYAECCEQFHTGKQLPAIALELMRSRYTAYYYRLVEYLVETTHKDKLKSSYRKQLKATIDQVTWTKLEILKTSLGEEEHKSGRVAFTAHYQEGGQAKSMTEDSRFRKYLGRWYYYDGK